MKQTKQTTKQPSKTETNKQQKQILRDKLATRISLLHPYSILSPVLSSSISSYDDMYRWPEASLANRETILIKETDKWMDGWMNE